MGVYFGTDGFRGVAGESLTADHAYRIGRFIGWYFSRLKDKSGKGERARAVIGKDTRLSGYMLEYALIAGLTASGADAYIMHVTTTPSVAYIAKADNFDCGIMISASHNPYYDNGIKLINGSGEKMGEDVITLVEAYLCGKPCISLGEQRELPFATRDKTGKAADYEIGRKKYVDRLISLGELNFSGVKVGLDCANGSTYKMAEYVFGALGATAFVINAAPNGTNINAEAGSTHIEGLRRFVVENGLDVGFAFDGDGDRCLCVDEKGSVLTGDHILYICARYMKESGELSTDKVVTTVMSNFGLYKALDEVGIKYAKTAVGDKHVYECMARNGCGIGGEQSGHIIFSRYASTGDGILTALKIMQVMRKKGKKLSELAEPLKTYPQVLKNVRVNDKAAAMADRDVRAAIAAAESELSGIGRMLVRPSGTEPFIRVMAEAESKETCERCVYAVASAIERKGYTA